MPDLIDYKPFHNSQRVHEVYVEEKPKQEALKRLRERMDTDESSYEILGIDEQHKYYADKIVAGLCPLSYALYGRIMNLDEEDDFSG